MSEKREKNRENINYTYHSFTISGMNSPASFPEHWHRSAEFILAMKDGCSYSVGQEQYHLNTGDVLLIWPTEIHSVIRTPEQASLIIQFDSSIIYGNSDLNGNVPLIQYLHLISRKELPVLNETISALMQNSLEIYNKKDLFIETKIKMNLWKILLELCSYEIEKEGALHPQSDNSGMTFLKIRDACAFIARNCSQDITQQDAAEYAGFSHYYFSRIFREYTSMTFSEYLARQRLNLAIQMLSRGTEQITEIAYRAGFQSISNFNRVFRLYMHCSPREYRDMYHSTRAQQPKEA